MSIGGETPEPPPPPTIPKVEKTEYEKTLTGIAGKQWVDYKQRYRPLETRFMSEVDKMDSPQERERMRGMAAATVQQSFGAGTPGFGGGGFTQSILDSGRARASALSKGISKSDMDTEARYRAGKENIISMGRDIQNQGIEGLSRAASLAQTKAFSDSEAGGIRAQGNYDRAMGMFDADQTRNAMWSDIAGSAVGFGLQRYYGDSK